ncbi:MAG: hypothetical protein OEZ48_07725 [Candidatus Bathyarchaeota archaeon]|nr:hypothetical protein [Candidatus Bathyarchaeota archaeon]
MSDDISDEASRDAKNLLGRINPDDYETLKQYWQKKSFTLIAYMLRRYGIEFKGLTYLERLVAELIRMKGER